LEEQEESYKSQVLDKNTKILAVEASSGVEWYKFADEVLSMNSFGASAPVINFLSGLGFTIGWLSKAKGLVNFL